MFRYGPMYENSPRYGKEPWLGRMEPCKIIANTYFVGTYQASCHLIDTGDGLILIDPGYSNTLYLVVDSIRKLGFDPGDIRYILCTHWHGDHTAATRPLVGISGAADGYMVSWTTINEAQVPATRRAGYERLNIRKITRRS